jgi:hypothetical protein
METVPPLYILDTNIERNYTGLSSGFMSEAKCSGTVYYIFIQVSSSFRIHEFKRIRSHLASQC